MCGVLYERAPHGKDAALTPTHVRTNTRATRTRAHPHTHLQLDAALARVPHVRLRRLHRVELLIRAQGDVAHIDLYDEAGWRVADGHREAWG